jgi:tRNA(Ile)-lysidine synthase TilS/MesJ
VHAAGHNADDIAETVLLNILRGDAPRLGRCASIITGEEGALPRVKPFKYTYEKEIVMYAFFKKLDYFSTECIYAPYAARGAAREFVKDLEVRRLLHICLTGEICDIRPVQEAGSLLHRVHLCALCCAQHCQNRCERLGGEVSLST